MTRNQVKKILINFFDDDDCPSLNESSGVIQCPIILYDVLVVHIRRY